MANYIWAKLWIDILQDPKMGTLSHYLWRRFFELVMVAKSENDNGFLPSFSDISWQMHIPVDEVEDVLEQLANVRLPEDPPDKPGLVRSVNDRWQITNFEKRQAPVSNDDRQRYYRERKRKEALDNNGGVTENVTDMSRESNESVTKSNGEKRREEKRAEIETEQIVSIITATPPPQQVDQKEGGAPTPPPPMNTITAEQIQHYLEHPDPALTECWRIFTIEYTAANRTAYNDWISKLKPIHMDDESILLGAWDGYVEEWCRERLIIPIRRTLSGAIGHQVNVSFCVLPLLQPGGG